MALLSHQRRSRGPARRQLVGLLGLLVLAGALELHAPGHGDDLLAASPSVFAAAAHGGDRAHLEAAGIATAQRCPACLFRLGAWGDLAPRPGPHGAPDLRGLPLRPSGAPRPAAQCRLPNPRAPPLL